MANAFDKTDEGYKTLAWILYWTSLALWLVGLIPFMIFFCLFVFVGILILSYIRKSDAADTPYGSHFANVFFVGIVGTVASFFLLVLTIGTLGIGLIITIPAWIGLTIWSLYRYISGMLKLQESSPYQ